MCILSTRLSKNMHLKYSFNQKKHANDMQKRASKNFLDPIQKRAL